MKYSTQYQSIHFKSPSAWNKQHRFVHTISKVPNQRLIVTRFTYTGTTKKWFRLSYVFEDLKPLNLVQCWGGVCSVTMPCLYIKLGDHLHWLDQSKNGQVPVENNTWQCHTEKPTWKVPCKGSFPGVSEKKWLVHEIWRLSPMGIYLKKFLA